MSNFDELMRGWKGQDLRATERLWNSSIAARLVYSFSAKQREAVAGRFIPDFLFCLREMHDDLSMPLHGAMVEDGGRIYLVVVGGRKLVSAVEELLPRTYLLPPDRHAAFAALAWPKPYSEAKALQNASKGPKQQTRKP